MSRKSIVARVREIKEKRCKRSTFIEQGETRLETTQPNIDCYKRKIHPSNIKHSDKRVYKGVRKINNYTLKLAATQAGEARED